MSEWSHLEPSDLAVLQDAFEKSRVALKIQHDSEASREMARYLFKLYAGGVVTVEELVSMAIAAKPQR